MYLPLINQSDPIIECMDTEAPEPRCPFCGTPMQFKRSIPNFGAHSELRTFDCSACQATLIVPPTAEIFELAAR